MIHKIRSRQAPHHQQKISATTRHENANIEFFTTRIIIGIGIVKNTRLVRLLLFYVAPVSKPEPVQQFTSDWIRIHHGRKQLVEISGMDDHPILGGKDFCHNQH